MFSRKIYWFWTYEILNKFNFKKFIRYKYEKINNFKNKKILYLLHFICNIYANKITISYNYTLYRKFDI